MNLHVVLVEDLSVGEGEEKSLEILILGGECHPEDSTGRQQFTPKRGGLAGCSLGSCLVGGPRVYDQPKCHHYVAMVQTQFTTFRKPAL